MESVCGVMKGAAKEIFLWPFIHLEISWTQLFRLLLKINKFQSLGCHIFLFKSHYRQTMQLNNTLCPQKYHISILKELRIVVHHTNLRVFIITPHSFLPFQVYMCFWIA